MLIFGESIHGHDIKIYGKQKEQIKSVFHFIFWSNLRRRK